MQGVEILAARDDRVLTDEALAFVAGLHRDFDPERTTAARCPRRSGWRDWRRASCPTSCPATASVRDDHDWRVAETPADLQDRRVEITGPVDRKMVINALNSGARVFMADFEDANSPTWQNCVEGQANLIDAVDRTISLETGGKDLLARTRRSRRCSCDRAAGTCHEKHVLVDGAPISASLFDFGLYVFHCAARLGERGSGPYFYLPKLESHLEARLWNDVFVAAQERLGIPRGTIRATVLIETILAAFEMEEILYELREHSSGPERRPLGLHVQRDQEVPRPGRVRAPRPGARDDDGAVHARVHASCSCATCHRRGAHAIGGMAAFIPSRRDPEINAVALEKVTEDKIREASDGFDGTWVAHPDLVPTAMAEFDRVLGDRPNQVSKQREDVSVTAADLLDVAATPGDVTDDGVRAERLGRHPVHRLLARRDGRGGDQQPDGGRRDRRDLPLADLAVGPARARRAGRRSRRGRGRGSSGSATRTGRRPSSSSGWRSTRTSSSS